MEKMTLKKYIFDNLFDKTEGMPLKDIAASSSNITDIFIEFRNLLISEGVISPSDKISQIKLIKHNGIDYLIVKKLNAEYVIIDVVNKKFLSDQDKDLFDEKFFIENFHEIKNVDYDFYSFNSGEGNIDHIMHYFLKHQDILSLDKLYIFFTLEDDAAKTLVYYNFTNGDVVVHFMTADNMSNEQIYLYRDFVPSDVTISSFTSNIPNIKVPKEEIPDFILKNNKMKKVTIS